MTKLSLNNFRKHKSLDLDFDNVNIFIGKNGVGKTTVLEAIYCLSLSKSFKAKDRHLISEGEQFYKIKATLSDSRRLEVMYSKLGKVTKINNCKQDRLSDYVYSYNVVLFAPEDLSIVKGEPLTRRRFMDLEIGQISKDYIIYLSKYKKTLKERNLILKEFNKYNDQVLLTYTEELSKLNELLVAKRKEFISRLNTEIKKIHEFFTHEDLEVVYKPSLDSDFLDKMVSKIPEEKILKTTSLGIHKDDIKFYLNNKEAKLYASQGQIRSIAISLKLALIEIITKENKKPLLLLDDVFSELDTDRQTKLLTYINDLTQTFISTNSLSDLSEEVVNKSKIFNL